MPPAISTADPIDVFVGQRLRTERMHVNMTQSDLGAAMGVTFQQVQKYERGANRISASMLLKAANAMGITVADLFPASPDDVSKSPTDIQSMRGGSALVEYFTMMRPAQRLILLQVAQEFARLGE